MEQRPDSMQLNQGLKMSRKITSFCVVLLLTLTSVSAARRRLNSINELTDCYQGEHTNILELLHWFANAVNINGNVIQLTFDPNHQYGSHHYGNYDYLLESPPRGHRYYTVGNIHKDGSKSLPPDVRNSQSRTEGWNRARIVFSANRDGQIAQVFITEHDGPRYDLDCTYEVTTNLLRQFRRRNLNEIQQLHGGRQTVSFGNTSYLQGPRYSQQFRYTSQSNTGNGEMNCLSIFFVAVVIFIIFVLLISSANMRK